MSNRQTPRPSYSVPLMRDDMALKGWLPTDLARRADVSDQTVSRFLRGDGQTAPTAKKLAAALGHSLRRYLIPSHQDAAPAASSAIEDATDRTTQPAGESGEFAARRGR